MSIKLLIPLVFVFLLFLYFTFFNPDSVSITLYPDMTYRVPLVILVMTSFFLGVVIAFFVSFFQVFRLQLAEYQTKRKQYFRHRIDSLYEEALGFMALGRKKDAERRFQKILKSDPDHLPTLLALGCHYREQGGAGEAIQFHAKAKTEHPQNIRVLTELVEDQLAAQRPNQAYEMVLELEKLNGESKYLYKKLRDSFIQKRNWEKAHLCQKKVLWFPKEELDGDAEKRILTGLEYEMGIQWYRRGEKKKAFNDMKKIIRSDREFVPAYLLSSEIHMDQDRSKNAIKILLSGFRNTESLVCIRKLEDLYSRLERKDEILQLYQSLKKERPGDRTARIMRMCSTVKYGDPETIQEEISELLKDGTKTTLIRLLEGMAMTKGRVQGSSPAVVHDALQTEIATRFRYQCSRCNHLTPDYVARCEVCGLWSSYSLVLVE